MIYKRPTAPAVEPITIAQARIQIGLDSSDTSSDTMLNALIAAAREFVENYTNRSLITAVWNGYLDSFEDWGIQLFKLPISEITSIKYYDSDDTEQTLDADLYVSDIISEPARIFPASGESWPSTYDRPNAVKITFNAGYGAAETDVPKLIKAAMLMMITHLEANRGDEGFRTLPATIYDFLNDYRLQII